MKTGTLTSGVVAVLTVVAWYLAEWPRLALPTPFEDAAMLYRYAENLAQGGGISWNFGQDPSATDGATDLGFVLVIAPLLWLGLSTHVAAILLNLTAVFLTGLAFGLLNSKIWRGPALLPIVLAAVVFSGPVNRYVLSGFSPPVMGFLLLCAFAAAILGAKLGRQGVKWLATASTFAGIAGWWRPEGFAFGLVAVIAGLIVMTRGNTLRRWRAKEWLVVAGPYTLIAVGWIGFRLAYVGQLLPTSALMKSGSLSWDNFNFSLQFYASLLLPFISILVVRTWKSPNRRWLLASVLAVSTLVWLGAAIPKFWWGRLGLDWMVTVITAATWLVLIPILAVGIWTALRRKRQDWVFPAVLLILAGAWVAIETTLNWWGRMQWPLVPLLSAIGVSALLTHPAGNTSLRISPFIPTYRAPMLLLSVVALVGLLPFHLPRGGYEETPFHTAVAQALEGVDTQSIRLATTEAGLIPLSITGAALDAYGHNDREIAATGGASLSRRLEDFRPNMVVIHGPPPRGYPDGACSSELLPSAESVFGRDWLAMVSTMYAYLQQSDLQLIRLVETGPCDTWSIWLDESLSGGIQNALREQSIDATDLWVTALDTSATRLLTDSVPY